MVEITINGETHRVEEGMTILSAASAGDVYIPSLCHHPDLRPFDDLPLAVRVYRGLSCHENQPADGDQLDGLQGCGLCAVEVAASPEVVRACRTPVQPGMVVHTDSEPLRELRRESMMKIMTRHPHACLTCAQREGCSLEDCSSNVPKEERCCWKFHHCELRSVAEYVGIKEETPRFRPGETPVLDDEPLITRDFGLCIDCARCVRACNELRGVGALGLVHHGGEMVVGSVGPTLMASACKFCGACVEVCPTGCLKDRGAHAGDRQRWLVPCVHTCPAGADVPGYIRRIAAGDFRGAAALVWETLPLANTLGHVCFHSCECECRREAVDEPIAICALKRFALASADGSLLSEAIEIPESGKKVAVVGAGPAGLAAGFFLRFKGHDVTLLEAAPSPGGMAAQSIPEYRLPAEVLQKDLDVIRNLGVTIKTGCRLPTVEAMVGLLRDEGYDALLLAVGLPDSKRLTLEGDQLHGVLWGLEFLCDVKAGRTPELGANVVVVGGGNVAIDVAMTALRISGGKVRLFCLESREEMPAHAHEIAQAEAEGVEINNSWGPAAIVGPKNKAGGVVFKRCLAVFDEQRKFAPRFDDHDHVTIDADTVILAVGQAAREQLPAEQDGVFLAGDIAGGADGGSIVHAVASGRAAAERIDRHLGGDGHITVQLAEHAPPDPHLGRNEDFAPQPRVPVPCAPPSERSCDFRQIEGGYSVQQAVAEAERCLQCDLRLLIGHNPLPPEKWLEFNSANVAQAPDSEGVYVLADPEKTPTMIKGAEDLQAALVALIDAGTEAHFFHWEEDRMYTKRESELIQQHLQQFGELPGGGDDELDDLF